MQKKQTSTFVALAVVASFGIAIGWLLYQQLARERDLVADPVASTPMVTQPIVAPSPEYSLGVEEREHLWSLEHHGNLLNKIGFQHLIEAWRDQNRADLLEVFDEAFQAKLIQYPASHRLAAKTDLVDVSRHESTSASAVDTSREAFVDWLLELRRKFADEPAPRGRFDVMTLVPPAADQPSGSWTATCLHRLWGEARTGGPLEVVLKLSIATDELSRERLEQPGWLRACDVQQIDEGHAEHPLFQEVTERTGINTKAFHDNWLEPPGIINSGGLYACDFNQDGFTDLFITDIRPAGNRFYLGRAGGEFEHATLQVGLQDAQNTTIAAFADLDNDGWPDLILPQAGRVFRNDQGRRFREATRESNLGALIHSLQVPEQHITAVVPADYDRDGLIDLYVTRSVPPVGSWLESRQPDMVANQLLRNLGDWSFFEVTQQTGTGSGGGSCFSAVWTDINNDLWPDLYLINEFGNGALLVNREGKSFEEQELVEAQNDFGSMGVSCGDINNDGNIDIYVSNMYSKAGSRIMGNMQAEGYPEEVKQRLRHMVAGGELYQNQGDLRFRPVGKDYQVHAAGWAWGSSLADFDNDGWLDLYVTAGFMSRDRAKPDG